MVKQSEIAEICQVILGRILSHEEISKELGSTEFESREDLRARIVRSKLFMAAFPDVYYHFFSSASANAVRSVAAHETWGLREEIAAVGQERESLRISFVDIAGKLDEHITISRQLDIKLAALEKALAEATKLILKADEVRS
jgi:hypothetical protein